MAENVLFVFILRTWREVIWKMVLLGGVDILGDEAAAMN